MYLVLEVLRAELEHRATHDPLAGIGNRAALMHGLTAALACPARRGWLMLLDLDGFKAVNDTLGHPVGDALLVDLAAGFIAVAPPDALVTRLGGDEFAVVLRDAEEADAVLLTEQILVLAARQRSIDGFPVRVSASIGLLPLARAVDVSAALRDADVALYQAKSAGRDRYRMAGAVSVAPVSEGVEVRPRQASRSPGCGGN